VERPYGPGSACVPEAPSGRAGVGAQRGLDRIGCSGAALHLDVTAEELERGKKSWTKPELPLTDRECQPYIQHVQQADKGADLDFAGRRFRAQVSRDLIDPGGGVETRISQTLISAYEFTPCLLASCAGSPDPVGGK